MSYLFINSQKVDYKLIWILASDLQINENQTRNRNDVGSIAQINSIANNLQPELLEQSFELSTGAPVIDSNNNIISGHGRVEAIKVAYFDFNLCGKYQDYQDYMINKFKLPIICKKTSESSSNCYILCRLINAKYNTVANIHAANNATLSYTPYELAKINSKRLKPTLEQFIISLPLLEQSQYFTDGILNLKAHEDFLAAKIIAALPNCAILADFINYPNPDFKNIITAILNNIDTILDIQQNHALLFSQFSLALDKFLQIKQTNGSVEDFLLQLDMFDNELNGVDFSNCLSVLWNNTRSAKLLTNELAAILNKNANLSLFDDNPSSLENPNIADTPTTSAVSKIIPREWQANTLQALNAAPKEADKTIICAPTGAGKMVFIMLLIQQMLQCNKNVLVLVDRVALVNQLSECANKYGITHNVIQSDNSKLVNSNITIASIQSYFSLATPMATPDVLIVDEAHTMYQDVSNFIQSDQMRVFGLTATPITKGLGNVYNSIINATTAQELTTSGSLVGFTPYVMTKIDMTGAKTFAGEFVATEIHQRSAKIYGDVVQGYKQYALNKRAICFCANAAHCNDVYQQFTDEGIPVGVYTSKTPERERKKLLKQFDNSEIMILISISALSKGFDKPYIECILDLRPLRRSLAEYVQMVGRGLRSCEGKTDCLLLDFSGNWDRFADDFEYLFANGVSSLNDNEYLSRHRSDNAALTTKCPDCGHSMSNTCMKCGYQLFKKTKIQNKITVELNNIYAVERNRISTPSSPPPVLNNTIWSKLKQMFESKLK
jgi:DNA repair protein RadD